MIFDVTMVIVLEAQQTVPCKQGHLSAFPLSCLFPETEEYWN